MCNYEASCLACDALPWQFNQPRAYFKGKVVLFSRFMVNGSSMSEGQRFVTIEFNSTEQGICLLPWSNIVGKLEEAGAKGVLFVDDSDTPQALNQNGVPRKAINIPSFDIPRSIGISVIIFNLLSNSTQDGSKSGITVRLPRISGGASAESSLNVSGDSDRPGSPVAVDPADSTGSTVESTGSSEKVEDPVEVSESSSRSAGVEDGFILRNEYSSENETTTSVGSIFFLQSHLLGFVLTGSLISTMGMF